MNLLRNKSENLFSDSNLRVIMTFCWAEGKICFLTTSHGHLPLLSCKAFFPDNTGFGYLLFKFSRPNYMQIWRNYTHLKSIWQMCDCVHALRCNLTPTLEGGRGQIGKQICLKNSWHKLNYNCITLLECNKSFSCNSLQPLFTLYKTLIDTF